MTNPLSTATFKVMDPKVSIIIPTKDRWDLLERALLSLKRQDNQDFQVIIVDDHSEKSAPLHLGKNSNVSVIPSQGVGVSAARNTGIKRANTPFIALLDSDDEWEPTKLSKQIHFLEQQHPELLLVHTNERWLRNGEPLSQLKKHQKSGGRLFSRATELCLISPSSVLIRQSLFQDVGLFNEEFVVCEDYEFWLRITARFEVGFITEPLTIKHGGHEDQLSRKYHSMDLWRVRALSQHLHSPWFSFEEQQKLRLEIQKKAKVLIKGFQKHQNLKNLKEVEDILLHSSR